jgi:phosphatidylinositol alpha-1,6-mannosyltransferase
VGGIQTLLHRIAAHAKAFEPCVVTRCHDEARLFDSTVGFAVRRNPPARLGYRATVARLNASALTEAWRFRPDVILSGHIVMAPAAAVIRRALRKPVAQYLHGSEMTARPYLASFSVRQADASIAVSRFTRDLAIAAGVGADKVHVIPPGADLPAEDVSAERDATPTVLTVARLRERYKGHDVLLRALPLVAARVPDVRWVVIGDGPLRGELETLAATYGVADRVDLLGTVSDVERDTWFRRAHVFAMPARIPASGAGEGFGIAFLEASMHRLPVVAGGVGGALDAVVDGETGVFVDPTEHSAVANALVDLLRDPERARRLGAAGAERARREFGWSRIAARVEALLQSLVEANR